MATNSPELPEDGTADGTPEKKPPKDERTPSQSRLAALLAPLAVGALLLLLIGLAVSSIMGRFDEGDEWWYLAKVIELSTALKAGLVVLLCLISVAIAVFSEIHTSGRALKWLFSILVASIVLGLVLLIYTSQAPNPLNAIQYHVGDTFCPLGTEGTDDVKNAVRMDCIKLNVFGFWAGLLGWLGFTLATILRLDSALLDKLRKVVGKDAVNSIPRLWGN